MALEDDDEVTYYLKTLNGGKKLVLTVESTNVLSNHDYIMTLEAYLSDLIRASGQLEALENKTLH
jgi:hypothetical protein